MSTQKEKFLASAQKFIQKGQFERALKDYEQVVTADPKDVRHRQKLAELLVRCNRQDDAVREYETIARYYDENGFYLKSIAVYKQMQRLDPANIGISLNLAQLNEKQGLVGNALSEYKVVYDHYHKSGETEEEIKVLERMKGVDPQNAEIRLKLAETLSGAGRSDSAYKEFSSLALSLKERGRNEQYERVYHRIQELFPDRKESVLEILSAQVRSGAVEEPVNKLKSMIEEDPGNVPALTLLAEAYRVAGDSGLCKETLRKLIQVAPDDLNAVKGLVECEIGGGDLERGAALLGQYLPMLLQAGCYADVERHYTRLLEQAPYDLRLLEGLRRLYETSGDQSKLADVQVSINILSKESRAEAASAETENEAPSVPVEVEVPDFPWQDEIDLSNAPDLSADSAHESVDTGPVLLNPEELAIPGESGEKQVADAFEIDISMDLPELLVANEPETAATAEAALPDESAETVPAPEAPSLEFLEDLQVDLEVDGDRDLLQEEAEAAFAAPEEQIEILAPVPEETFEAATPAPDEIITLSEELPEAPAANEPVAEAEKTAGESFGCLFGEDSDENDLDGDDKGIFPRIGNGIEEQVDSHDTETRYNLGIAYMEMALYDEAIGEFRAAARDPGRAMDCLSLEGLCFGRKGDVAGAEKVFMDALSREGLDTDRILSIRYELGALYENAGRKDDALKAYREVFHTNPGFRDTMKKIARLSRNGDDSFDLSDINDADIELDELV